MTVADLPQMVIMELTSAGNLFYQNLQVTYMLNFRSLTMHERGMWLVSHLKSDTGIDRLFVNPRLLQIRLMRYFD